MRILIKERVVKVRNSLKYLTRLPGAQVVRRRGRCHQQIESSPPGAPGLVSSPIRGSYVHHLVRHYQDAILTALDSARQRIGAGALHDLRHHGTDRGLSTVYRTLQVFVAAGTIYPLPLLDEIVYEKATETILDAFSCVVRKHTVRMIRSDTRWGDPGMTGFLSADLPAAVRGVCTPYAVLQTSPKHVPGRLATGKTDTSVG